MNVPTRKFFRSGFFRLGVGVGISGLLFYLAAREVNLSDAWLAILAAKPSIIFLAVGSVAANTLFKVFRWKDLLGPSGKTLPVRKLLSALLVGQLLNNFIPARIGDLSRAYTVGGQGPGRSYTFGTVVIEKMVDLFAYVLLLITLILLIPIPAWMSNSALPLATAAVTFTILVFALTYQRPRVLLALESLKTHLPGVWLPGAIQQVKNGLASTEILQDRVATIRVIVWSVLIWFTAILTNYLTLLALEIDVPLIASVLLLIALQAGISLAAIPGNLGLFEYIAVLTLGLFGIGQAMGFSYGILLHAIVLLPVLFAGLLAFWLSGVPRHTPAGREAVEQP